MDERRQSAPAAIFRDVTGGIRNSLAYSGVLKVLSSPRIRQLLILSVLVDGLGLSLLACVVHFVLKPMIHSIGVWFGSERNNTYGRIVKIFFDLAYFGGAYMPWSVASIQLSSFFCRKISQEIVNPGPSTPSPVPDSKKKFDVIAFALSNVLNMVPVIAILLELAVLAKIPYVGFLLEMMSRALYYSYVIWSFKWNVEKRNSPGPSIASRMSYMERNWPYYVGYSLTLVIVTACLPSNFVRNVGYAVLLPFWVILAHFSSSPLPAGKVDGEDDAPASAPRPSDSPQAPFKLPLFSVPMTLHRRASAVFSPQQ